MKLAVENAKIAEAVPDAVEAAPEIIEDHVDVMHPDDYFTPEILEIQARADWIRSKGLGFPLPRHLRGNVHHSPPVYFHALSSDGSEDGCAPAQMCCHCRWCLTSLRLILIER